MIVLGIDPGTARLGYGVIDTTGGDPALIDYGVAETHASESMPDRLLQIHSNVRLLLTRSQP